MATLVPADSLTSLMTVDPFCAQEGIQTLQSTGHYCRLFGLLSDLSLHVDTCHLPYTVVSDLLLRNIPLREGVSPDIALLPGQLDLVAEDFGSLDLSVDLCPALILEVVSENTHEADSDIKHEIYRLAGIEEYWLYDPRGFAGGPPLRGWQLQDTEYMPIWGEAAVVAGEEATLYSSAVLQTDWGLTADASLRLRKPKQDDWYRMTPEAMQQVQARADQAEIRARQERIHTEQARTRTKQAEARAEQESIRAEQESIRAEQERTRAEQAEARAEQADAEIARLRALLNESPD